MPKYRFDIGNSTTGPLGFAAIVRADTAEDALRLLKAALDEHIGEMIELDLGDFNADVTTVEYANVYLNTDAITVADINEEEPG